MSFMPQLISHEQLVPRDTSTGNLFQPSLQNVFELSSHNRVKDAVVEESFSDIHQYKMVEKFSVDEVSLLVKNCQQWEIQQNTSLQLKENQLKICSKNVEGLRKHIVELQLHNENLSQKLEENIAVSDEGFKKIELISNQCSYVQHFVNVLDERLATCEQTTVESKYFQTKNIKDTETLANSFKEITAEYENKCHIHLCEIKDKEKEILKLKDEFQALALNMEQKLCSMEIECNQKTNAVEEMRSNLNSLQTKITSQEVDNEMLKNKLEQNEHVMHIVEQQLSDKHNKVKEYEDLIQTTEKLLKKIENLIVTDLNEPNLCNEEEKELAPCAKMVEFQDTIYVISNTLRENKSSIASLTEKIQQLDSEIHNLKLQKDAIRMETANLNKHLKDLQDEKSGLSKAYEEVSNNLKTELEEKHKLAFECEQLRQLRKGEVENLQNEIIHKNKLIDGYTDEMKTLQVLCDKERDAKQNILHDLEKSKAVLNEKLKDSDKQLEVMQSEMKVLINKSSITEQQLADVNKNREQSERCIQELKEKIETQLSDKNNLCNELNLKTSELEKMETKLKSLEAIKRHSIILKKTILERTKCVNELKKIKTDLESNLKTKDEQLVIFEKEMADMKTSLVKEQEEKSKLALKLESGAKDMVALMENFKLNSQAIIKEKDKEIQECNERLENLKKEQDAIMTKKDTDIAELKTENDNLTRQLKKVTEEQADCLRQILEIRESLTRKDEEIVQLQNKNIMEHQSAASKPTTPQCTSEDGEIMKLQNKNVMEHRSVPSKPTTPQYISEATSTPKSQDAIVNTLKHTTTPIDKRKHVTFSKLPSPRDSETSTSEMEIEVVAAKPSVTSKMTRVSPYSISLRHTRSCFATSNSKTLSLSKQAEIFGDSKPIPRGQPPENAVRLNKKMKTETSAKFPDPQQTIYTTPKLSRRALNSTKEIGTEATMSKTIAGNKFFKSTAAERKNYWADKECKKPKQSDLDNIFGFQYD